MSVFHGPKCGPQKGPQRRPRAAARNVFRPSVVARGPVYDGPRRPRGGPQKGPESGPPGAPRRRGRRRRCARSMLADGGPRARGRHRDALRTGPPGRRPEGAEAGGRRRAKAIRDRGGDPCGVTYRRRAEPHEAGGGRAPKESLTQERGRGVGGPEGLTSGRAPSGTRLRKRGTRFKTRGPEGPQNRRVTESRRPGRAAGRPGAGRFAASEAQKA